MTVGTSRPRGQRRMWSVLRRTGRVLAAGIALSAAVPAAARAACPPSEPACPYLEVAVIGGTGEGVFRFPQAIALSPGGSAVYVADQLSARVQKFDRTGRFLAQWGSFGDGDAEVSQIGGLAADAGDRVYVLDSLNDRVQVFGSTGAHVGRWGTRGTLPGQFNLGINGGIAVLDDPSAGLRAYIADQDNHRIQRFALSRSTGLPDPGVPVRVWGAFGNCAVACTPLQLNRPQGVAVSTAPGHPHDVFVADDDNHRVLKFDADGIFLGQIGTPGVIGTGPGQFAFPYDVGVDSAHGLYVADNNNHRVQKFDAASLAFVAAWGGFGSASGQLEFPRSLAALASDPRGGVYVADTANNRVQAFESNGEPAVDSSGRPVAWGISGRAAGNFTRPSGLTVDRAGDLYVADTMNHRIEKLSAGGDFIAEWGRRNNGGHPASGSLAGEFDDPTGVAADPRNGDVYVADTTNNRVQRLAAGAWSVVAGTTFNGPQGVAVDQAGSLYVADTGANRIQRRDGATGAWSTLAGITLRAPRGVAVDPAGNVVVADTGNDRVVELHVAAGTWAQVGTSAGFSGPAGVAVDGQGRVSVADTGHDSIARIGAGGVTVRWGARGPEQGRFVAPAAVAASPAGDVYVADTFNNRVQRFVFSAP